MLKTVRYPGTTTVSGQIEAKQDPTSVAQIGVGGLCLLRWGKALQTQSPALPSGSCLGRSASSREQFTCWAGPEPFPMGRSGEVLFFTAASWVKSYKIAALRSRELLQGSPFVHFTVWSAVLLIGPTSYTSLSSFPQPTLLHLLYLRCVLVFALLLLIFFSLLTLVH
jgi:hypothetical protein